jgi:hypothetical protein
MEAQPPTQLWSGAHARAYARAHTYGHDEHVVCALVSSEQIAKLKTLET